MMENLKRLKTKMKEYEEIGIVRTRKFGQVTPKQHADIFETKGKLETTLYIIKLIRSRIKSMSNDEDGWAKEERGIAQEELRMLIKRIEGKKNYALVENSEDVPLVTNWDKVEESIKEGKTLKIGKINNDTKLEQSETDESKIKKEINKDYE